MKLLLTSNGVTNPELEQAFLALTENKKGLTVAIIPTASDAIDWVPEKEGSKKYIPKLKELTPEEQTKKKSRSREYKAKYEEKGHRVVVVDLKEDPARVQETLETVDIIDVPGGDPNYLVDWAKKAGVGTYLRDLLERGVVYLGSSAGSQLVLPDFGLTWWDPVKWKGEDHSGLGIVDFVLVPHQKESDPEKKIEALITRKKSLQSIIDFPWKVYLLQDGQAIKVDDDKIEHIGEGVKKSI